MERKRVSRNLTRRRHISATSRSVLQDRNGQGGPYRDRPEPRGPDVLSSPRCSGGITMKRKNLVFAAVIALVGAALAGTALAQVPRAGDEGSAFCNAQQYGRGGDFGRDHDGSGSGSQRERFRAMDLDGRWVADD